MQINKLYQSEYRHASWLELFFDLVFVAAIGMLTHNLAHTHHGHIGYEDLLKVPLVFTPMWQVWIAHTVYANRFDDDSQVHRLQTLLLMSGITILATFSQGIFEDTFLQFVMIYFVIRIFQSFMYFRVYMHHKVEADFAKGIAVMSACTALISLSSILFSQNINFFVFFVGIAVDVIWFYFLSKKIKTRPIDRSHIVERLGLLVIIILGESTISIITALTESRWNSDTTISALAGFGLLCLIWWAYFSNYDRLEHATRIDTDNILMAMHLFLCIGLLLLATLIQHAILSDLDQDEFGRLAVIGLTFYYLGKQIPYVVALPAITMSVVVNSAICIFVTYLSTFLPSIEYSLLGMFGGMVLYVIMNQWTLSIAFRD